MNDSDLHETELLNTEEETEEYETEDEYEQEEEEEQIEYPIDISLLNSMFPSYEGTRDTLGYFEGSGNFSFYHDIAKESKEEIIVHSMEEVSTIQSAQHALNSLGFAYNGQLTKGMMNNHGSIRWSDGQLFEGTLMDNEMTGQGRLEWGDGSFYEGNLVNGMRDGYGFFKNGNTGAVYEGEWRDGRRCGHGKLTYCPGQVYTGEFKDNERHGRGIMCYKSGNCYDGEWREDRIQGYGIMRWYLNNEEYEGNWQDGKPHGKGKLMYLNVSNETCNYYEGDFVNGQREGYGVFYYADGSKYEGCWQNNMKHGKGKYTSGNGIVKQCIFEIDKIIETLDEEGFIAASEVNRVGVETDMKTSSSLTSESNSDPTYVPLYVQDILVKYGTQDDISLIQRLIVRHLQKLKNIFQHYSRYGVTPEVRKVNQQAQEYEVFIDIPTKTLKRTETDVRLATKNTSQLDLSSVGSRVELVERQIVLSKYSDLSLYQYWKFAKDCNIIGNKRLSFADIGRIFIHSRSKKGELAQPKIQVVRFGEPEKTSQGPLKPILSTQRRMSAQVALNGGMNTKDGTDYHNSQNKIRFRGFVESLVRTASALYSSESVSLYDKCETLIEKDILPSFSSSIQTLTPENTLFISQKMVFEETINRSFNDLQQLFLHYHRRLAGGVMIQRHSSDVTVTVKQCLRMIHELGVIGDRTLPLRTVLSLFDKHVDDISEEARDSLMNRELIFNEFLDFIIQMSLLHSDIHESLSYTDNNHTSSELTNKESTSPSSDDDGTTPSITSQGNHFVLFLESLLAKARTKQILIM